ncbi:MAG: VCBS repeat-containing protein [Candidatus Aegiribacteria sp.]
MPGLQSRDKILKLSVRSGYALLKNLLLCILMSCSMSSAEYVYSDGVGYASQSSWNGGHFGSRVLDWQNMYESMWGMEADSDSGMLTLMPDDFVRKPLDIEEAVDISQILPHDIDFDGDNDIFVLHKSENRIGWLENRGDILAWTYHIIQDPFYKPGALQADDFDGDGTVDLAVLSEEDGMFVLYHDEYDKWNSHCIDRYGFNYSGSALGLFDVNSDGYMDIIARHRDNPSMNWWENPGESGLEWPRHEFDRPLSGFQSGDYDRDGQLELYGFTGDTTGEHDLLVHRYEGDEHTFIGFDHDPLNAQGVSLMRMLFIPDDETAAFHRPFARIFAYRYVHGYSDYRSGYLAFTHVDGSWRQDDVKLWDNWHIDRARRICCGDVDGDGDSDICSPRYMFEAVQGNVPWVLHHYGRAGSARDDTTFHSDGSIRHVMEDDLVLRNLVCSDLDGNGMDELLFLLDGRIWFIDHCNPERIGQMTSGRLVLDSDASWRDFNWTADVPDGTSLEFYFKFDYDETGKWFGPVTEPCNLRDFKQPYTYFFQYRVVMRSTNPQRTPVLHDVSANWIAADSVHSKPDVR